MSKSAVAAVWALALAGLAFVVLYFLPYPTVGGVGRYQLGVAAAAGSISADGEVTSPSEKHVYVLDTKTGGLWEVEGWDWVWIGKASAATPPGSEEQAWRERQKQPYPTWGQK